MVEMIVLKDREEWLQHRNRIGGSDAAAIVGLNPYRSNVELWQIKTGQMEQEDISGKEYVENDDPVIDAEAQTVEAQSDSVQEAPVQQPTDAQAALFGNS